ncbi:MAG: glycosyl hydrolase [Rhodoferax sp.]
MMKEFVFSPYLDINVALQSDSAPLPSSSTDSLEPLNDPPLTNLPQGIKALTLAFATGECGRERWGDLDAKTVAASHLKPLQRAGVGYVISTGGAEGIFTCSSEQGMAAFIAHYNSRHLLGLDFDIEAGQSESMIADLVEQVRIAMQQHPHLRFSFTLAALSSKDSGQPSLNQHGDLVMKAIMRAGLRNYFINLMVMNYGEAKSDNCVVESGRCNMAASAIQVVQNFSQRYGLPPGRIEVTPMIGVNDVVDNVFTLGDARALSLFVAANGLGGLHFWSLNRDQPCAQPRLAVSPTCSSLEGPVQLEFANTFALGLR